MSHDFLVSFPGLGIRDLSVSRVAFRLFGLEIYWYGILIAAAVVLCLFLAFREAPRFGISKDYLADSVILVMPLMVVCARLYYVLFEWPRYQGNWRLILDTRDGGLAFYGGLIGGVLALLIASRWRRIPFSRLVDFLVVYVPLGQAIGRWGNFFNQEAFGANTGLPWGMISNGTRDYLVQSQLPGVNPLSPVHPTFLYEFLANLLIFLILHRIRKESKLPFETLAWYVMTYGIVRFFVERIRTDALFIPGTEIRISLLLSVLMAVGGGLYIAYIRRRDRLQGNEAETEVAAPALSLIHISEPTRRPG